MAGTAENQNGEPLRPPPPLPRRLLALAPVVYVGTGGWIVVAVALAVARYAFDRTPPIWLWTALSGVALGIVGAGIMLWQQRAAERGSRTAQKVD
ncbi:hypothetical protein UO65_6001 [Actinokineospora spheciospongiae]|uniref:DUF2530 domain-containing protein n=1 Tax=Actinokineospora spheciospongiae TaxID=909613 RepID=W7ID33_9PSEU|nr:DUF2530 domain-containing protein [Actinokineospora spheciospongiae]EWC58750.1 hypothetical protein UO65_6001 [Actinokineospora spheciospongiae]